MDEVLNSEIRQWLTFLVVVVITMMIDSRLTHESIQSHLIKASHAGF